MADAVNDPKIATAYSRIAADKAAIAAFGSSVTTRLNEDAARKNLLLHEEDLVLAELAKAAAAIVSTGPSKDVAKSAAKVVAHTNFQNGRK